MGIYLQVDGDKEKWCQEHGKNISGEEVQFFFASRTEPLNEALLCHMPATDNIAICYHPNETERLVWTGIHPLWFYEVPLDTLDGLIRPRLKQDLAYPSMQD